MSLLQREYYHENVSSRCFYKELFRGNPAAVVVEKEWLDTDLMQKIALENNLSETAFVKL